MDAATVSKILSVIPDRVPRAHVGAHFSPEGASRYPERVRHLAGLLGWLSPLSALSKDDQKILGMLNAAGRPIHAADESGEEAGEEALEETMLEDGGADALEYMEAETAIGVREERRDTALA
ncbi:MAG TPA: hypothetical protein VF262_11195 [Burkholderiales bacterium]|jgi:hypothetical protein